MYVGSSSMICWTCWHDTSKVETASFWVIPLSMTFVQISSWTSGLMIAFGCWTLWVSRSFWIVLFLVAFLMCLEDWLILKVPTIQFFQSASKISGFGLACFKFQGYWIDGSFFGHLFQKYGWVMVGEERKLVGRVRPALDRRPNELDRAPRLAPREPDPIKRSGRGIKRSGRLSKSRLSCAKWTWPGAQTRLIHHIWEEAKPRSSEDRKTGKCSRSK